MTVGNIVSILGGVTVGLQRKNTESPRPVGWGRWGGPARSSALHAGAYLL